MASWLSAKISALGERVMDSVLDAVVQNQDLHLKNLQNMQQWNISRLVNRVVNAKYFYKQHNVEACADFDELFPSASPDPHSGCPSPSPPAPPRATSSLSSSFLVPQDPVGRLEIRIRSCSLVLFTAENGRILPPVAMLQRQQQHQQLLWQTVVHVENQEQRSPCYKMERKDAYDTNEILFDDSYEFPIRDLWTDICIDVVALKSKRHIIMKPATSSAANASPGIPAFPSSAHGHPSYRSSRSPVPSDRAAGSGSCGDLGAAGGGEVTGFGSTDVSLEPAAGAAGGDSECPEGSRLTRANSSGPAEARGGGDRGMDEGSQFGSGSCLLESPRLGATSACPAPDSEQVSGGGPSVLANPAGSPRLSAATSSSPPGAASSREGRYVYGRAILPLSAFLSSSPPQWETKRRQRPGRRKRESPFWDSLSSLRTRTPRLGRRKGPAEGEGDDGDAGRGRRSEEAAQIDACRVSRSEFWVQLFPENNKLSERKYLRPVKGFEEFGMKNPVSTLGFLHVTVAFEWAHRPTLSPLLSCLLPPSQLWVVPLKPEPHYVESFSRRCKDVLAEPPRWIDLFFHFGGHLEDRTWAGSCCWLLFWMNLLYGTCFAPFWQLPGCMFLAVALASFSYFLLRQNRFFVYSLPPGAAPTLPVAAPPLSFHTPTWAAPNSLPFFPSSRTLPVHPASSNAPSPNPTSAGSVESGGSRPHTRADAPCSIPSFPYRERREKGTHPLSAPLGDCEERSDLEDFTEDDASEDEAMSTGETASRRDAASSGAAGQGEDAPASEGDAEARGRRGAVDASHRLSNGSGDAPPRGAEDAPDVEGGGQYEVAERRQSSFERATSSAEAALATLGFSSFKPSSFSSFSKLDGLPSKEADAAEEERVRGEKEERENSSPAAWNLDDPRKEKTDVSPVSTVGAAASGNPLKDGEDAVLSLAGGRDDREEDSLLHPRRGRVSKVSSPFGDITLFVRESAKGEEGKGLKSDETWPVFADDETEPLVQEQLNKLIELATGLQIATGYISSVAEKVRYAFNWEDPFLSYASLFLLCFHCFLWCLLLYLASLVPLLVWRVCLFCGFLLFGVVTDPRVQARVDEKLQKEIHRRLESEQLRDSFSGLGNTRAAVCHAQDASNGAADFAPVSSDLRTRDVRGEETFARRRSSTSSSSSLLSRFPSSSSEGAAGKPQRGAGEAETPQPGCEAVAATPRGDREQSVGDEPGPAVGRGPSLQSLASRDKRNAVQNPAAASSHSWLAALVGPASTSPPAVASDGASAFASASQQGPSAPPDPPLSSSSSLVLAGGPLWNLLDVSNLIKRRGASSGRAVQFPPETPSPPERGREEAKPPASLEPSRTRSLGSEHPEESASAAAGQSASRTRLSLSHVSPAALAAGLPPPSQVLERTRSARITLFSYLTQETRRLCASVAEVYESILAYFPTLLRSPAAPCLRLLGVGAVVEFLHGAVLCPLVRFLESAVFTYFSLLHFWWARLPDRREIEHRLIASTQVISSLTSLLPASESPADKKGEGAAPSPVFAAVSPPSTASPLFPVDNLLFCPANRVSLAPPSGQSASASAAPVTAFLHKYFRERWEKENPLTASVYAAAPYLIPTSKKGGKLGRGVDEEPRETLDAPSRDELSGDELERHASKPAQKAREKPRAQDKDEIIARAASGGYAPEVAWFAAHLSPQELQRWQKEQAKRLPKHVPSHPLCSLSRTLSAEEFSPARASHQLAGSSGAERRKMSGREGEAPGDRASQRDERRRGDRGEAKHHSIESREDARSRSHASSSRSKTRPFKRERAGERGDRNGRVERFLGPVFGWGEDVAIVTHPARSARGVPDSFSPHGSVAEAIREPQEGKEKERSSLASALHFKDFPAFDLFFGRHKKASEGDRRRPRAEGSSGAEATHARHAAAEEPRTGREPKAEAKDPRREEGPESEGQGESLTPHGFESGVRRM
nr:TPA: hypothetical protein BN1204_014780 [Neospora caninum Liverpool]